MTESRPVKQLALPPFTQLMCDLPHFAFSHHLVLFSHSPFYLSHYTHVCTDLLMYAHVYMIG